jgi:hypothetical protein
MYLYRLLINLLIVCIFLNYISIIIGNLALSSMIVIKYKQQNFQNKFFTFIILYHKVYKPGKL